jgi:alpha-ketoglutarate-dependent taurine dioxygenase
VLAHAHRLQVVLREPGDTLLLDNWRLLHGRSPVSGDGHTRMVDRAYLEMLHS